MITHIYTDGGVCKSNPSTIGGTWCWAQVDEKGEPGPWKSGLVTPKDVGVRRITNNITELLAAIRGVESAPEGWEGVLVTDSQVTMHRLTHCQSFEGCPRWLIDRAVELRRGRRWKIELVAGHPTQTDLERGWKLKKGVRKTVSKYNAFCDLKCCEASNEWLKRLGDGK